MKTLTKQHVNKNRGIPYIHRIGDNREITFRRYKGPEDHQTIAEISQEYWDSVGLDYVISAEDVARSLKYLEHFNPHLNLIITERARQPVGFTQVNWWQETAGARLYRHITHIVPEGVEHGVNEPLLRFAESRLRQLARRHPAHLHKYFTTGASDNDKVSSEFLERNGYQHERYFFEMVRPLDFPIPNLTLPEGIELRAAEPRHYRKILAALDEAFLDHWGHRPIAESEIQRYFESPEFQPQLWKVTWDGDEVAGMVLNYIDKAENQRFARKRGYTEDIAVRQPWRRRGVARTLIALSLLELKVRGMEQAALGVDTQNPTGALQLYQSLGYEKARKHISFRKEISI